MSMNKYFRHTPAFILLFLAQKPAYGALLFKRLDEEMPFNLIDTPALYRALNGLEKEGAIEAYWDTSEPGPAKKWYRITLKGMERLSELKQDIEKRRQDLDFFLETYEKLQI
ncbi:Transcriptional regulator, PadR family [Methanosarcina horonobensis HB-1 = JCM 15518]|uniref:Transcriptional regulator, PadR family n=1 Tax=Methanosarcina horonobensis HB-1 = JCM 15518 TaxID=1434110 RepID=A0A0E3S6Y2_9EURY|nr:PadR family transcriptional regulator [Methanosarcina horonobensis]AKB77034.1 Transcriptional regulator, PadR family [Methanosarcina horonobensis HB-1 = JCM 15518]